MKREPSIPPMRALTISVVCFVMFLIAMAMIFGGCASSNLGKALNVGVAGTSTADYAITRIDLRAGLGREANPILGQDAIRQAVVKALGVGAVVVIAQTLERKERKTLAHVVRGVAVGVYGAAFLHNWRLAHR